MEQWQDTTVSTKRVVQLARIQLQVFSPGLVVLRIGLGSTATQNLERKLLLLQSFGLDGKGFNNFDKYLEEILRP